HPQGRARRQRARQDRQPRPQGQQVGPAAVPSHDDARAADPRSVGRAVAARLEDLGLADQLEPARLPTYVREGEEVRWRDPLSGATLDDARLLEPDAMLRSVGDDPAHGVPVELVRLRREGRLRAALLDGGWLDYAGVAEL